MSSVRKKISSLLESHKTFDILSIDVQMPTLGWVILADGRSKKHIQMVAETLRKELKKIGIKNVNVEGLQNSSWILIDVEDGFIHLFQGEARTRYNLEELYG